MSDARNAEYKARNAIQFSTNNYQQLVRAVIDLAEAVQKQQSEIDYLKRDLQQLRHEARQR